MSTEPVRFETPEERELVRLQEELSALEDELGHAELELASLKGQLSQFEARYYREVGSKYAEMDELKARQAEVAATANPAASDEARRAREQANSTREEVDQKSTDTQSSNFEPSSDLKALFRKLAAKVHPDLASDESDRVYRTEFFKSINSAYRTQDADCLTKLALEWELRPESIPGQDIGAQLVRCIRKVAQIRSRIDAIRRELASIQRSDLFALFIKSSELQTLGRDLLSELADDLEHDLAQLRRHYKRAMDA